jgi:hypothetical protein
MARRVFPRARRTISLKKTQLGAETVERIECLKHWQRSGISKENLERVDGVVMPRIIDRYLIGLVENHAGIGSLHLNKLLSIHSLQQCHPYRLRTGR